MSAGRFAPSPSGPLHVGNLRTAMFAWACARKSGRDFILRIDDIDPGRGGAEEQQIGELKALGIDWDGPVRYQSENRERHREVFEDLRAADLVFPCFCSRKDIREAARAPHVSPAHYPGNCLHLTDRQVKEFEDSGRLPAWRLRPPEANVEVLDLVKGRLQLPVDSLVLWRKDDWPAYNLATVIDDLDSDIDQVVRGDDLLAVAPAQTYLRNRLGGGMVEYAHIPLVLGSTGARLAKRDGAVTLEELIGLGLTVDSIARMLWNSLGVPDCSSMEEFLRRYEIGALPSTPLYFDTVRTAFVRPLSPKSY